MKLQRINKNLYITENGYKLEKAPCHFGKRINLIYRLYAPDGKYIGQPPTIAEANEWIKEREV